MFVIVTKCLKMSKPLKIGYTQVGWFFKHQDVHEIIPKSRDESKIFVNHWLPLSVEIRIKLPFA